MTSLITVLNTETTRVFQKYRSMGNWVNTVSKFFRYPKLRGNTVGGQATNSAGLLKAPMTP